MSATAGTAALGLPLAEQVGFVVRDLESWIEPLRMPPGGPGIDP